MIKNTLTFRLDASKKKAIDSIAAFMDRDRSYVINEALEKYIELHQWQIQHIENALKEADTGKFATEKEVEAVFAKLRK